MMHHNPTFDYWTIHIIGAFRNSDGSGGCYGPNTNTIFIFIWTKKQQVDDWNSANPSSTPILYSRIIQRTTLHEIGHAFTLQHERNHGVMYTYIDPITGQEYSPSIGDQLSIDWYLNTGNIKTVQQQSKPD
ncbi:MAG: hypothetical protein LBE12_02820 [Planctomycetaceae bacterium]|nr:hypothetical protein [Planctomycetaceae bacterium]